MLHSKKRVLITGGAGFLGSFLCERLLKDGCEVLCVDNFYTGSKMNILHLLDHPFFEILRHDITFPLYVETDEIYNLACPASPVHYQNDPVQTTKVNVHGSINVLGLAKRLKIKIFQASTSEVYGDPFVHPQDESYWGNVNPIGIRSCYDEGKRCAETLFFDYRRQHGLKIKVARIFNTYGPRMHPHDDPRKRLPDIRLAEEKLGWEPKIDLKEGLAWTIDYFKKLEGLSKEIEIGPMQPADRPISLYGNAGSGSGNL